MSRATSETLFDRRDCERLAHVHFWNKRERILPDDVNTAERIAMEFVRPDHPRYGEVVRLLSAAIEQAVRGAILCPQPDGET